jgi:hypothetical protein
VKSLTELYGGRIEAESEGLGCGSRFTIRPPRRSDGRLNTTLGDGNLGKLTRGNFLRILVVDDNQDAAPMLTDYSKQLGMMSTWSTFRGLH